MYAIHLTPSGSTYTAEKEEFVRAERTSFDRYDHR